jgi:hypothetical protein
VLSLSDFPHVADRLVLAALTHWLDIRRGNPLPRRRDLDPCAIPAVLPFLALYQYLPDEQSFLCRLAGAAIYGAIGKPTRGRRLAEFMSSYVLLETPMRAAVEGPAVVHGIGRFTFNGHWMDAETIMLPFADDGRTGDAVLHVVSNEIAPPLGHRPLAQLDLLSTTTPAMPDPVTGAIVSTQRRKLRSALAAAPAGSEEIPLAIRPPL